ncbi:hypothetical protein [Planomonospora sp. ID82291]|uniref:hypothetical protein n=1 Tax=Planomonospora sp. ID82291 TaxID=2738136 RepID=UPI0018C3F3AD|nr:hypothetical protein [Planomonospora sp. ID82291]MBG0818734.1 hypothetical protein [Planomonospora sp. ID82291]
MTDDLPFLPAADQVPFPWLLGIAATSALLAVLVLLWRVGERRAYRRAHARLVAEWDAGRGPRGTMTWSPWRRRFIPSEVNADPGPLHPASDAAPATSGDSTPSRWAAAKTAAIKTAPGLLLVYFLAVIAGLSATGLTGFGADNMGLTGPWPYLLFFALDGAAALCAVLQTRRVARNEAAGGPRLAVWGLILASAYFNATHAPDKPGAAAAYALLPIVGAVLFEFVLAETRRGKHARPDRKLDWSRWLHPVERIRVELILATDEQLTAAAATLRVRVLAAARHLYALHQALVRLEQATGRWAERNRRKAAIAAERKAQAALIHAGVTDPDVMVAVVREMQVLTQARRLATLDYTNPSEAALFVANLMVAPSEEALAALRRPLPTLVPAADPALRAEATGAGSAGEVPLAAPGTPAGSTLPAPHAPLGAGAGSGGQVPPAGSASAPAPVPSGAASGGGSSASTAGSGSSAGAGKSAGSDELPRGRLAKQKAARAAWEAAITAGGPLLTTADLMEVSGAAPSTARNWRAAWIKEPEAAALDVGAADVPEETPEEFAARTLNAGDAETGAANGAPSAPSSADAMSAVSAASDDSDREPALV